jgi:hypothetical protein
MDGIAAADREHHGGQPLALLRPAMSNARANTKHDSRR